MNNTPFLTGIDVGSPRISGQIVQSGSDVEMVAGGADIWGARDEFHFAYVLAAGNFELSACLVSLTMADVYTKAGLMLRSSLAPGAELAYLLAFGDNQPRNNNNGGLEFQYRQNADGPSTGIYPPQPLPAQPDFPVLFPNVWLKLIREGDTITAQSSRDGEHWKTYCAHRQLLPPAGYLGLAVTSHDAGRSVQAVFRRLHCRSNP
jgi:hypothetical protein